MADCKGHYYTFHLDTGEVVHSSANKDNHESADMFAKNSVTSQSGWCSFSGQDTTKVIFDRAHIVFVEIECVK